MDNALVLLFDSLADSTTFIEWASTVPSSASGAQPGAMVTWKGVALRGTFVYVLGKARPPKRTCNLLTPGPYRSA